MTQKILSEKEVTKQFGDGTVLLSVPEASRKFGVSASWLYTHKELPTLRIGKGIRYVESELIAYFKRQSLRLQ